MLPMPTTSPRNEVRPTRTFVLEYEYAVGTLRRAMRAVRIATSQHRAIIVTG